MRSFIRRAARGLAIVAIALASIYRVEAGEVDVYGRLNLTLQNSDEAAGEQVELRNNSSRVGVKGEEEIAADLKVIYQLEFGVNIDDSEQDTFTPRNQFVGLQGAFGTVKVGRHDTALKQAQGDLDLFDDLEGDIGEVFNGENRLANYIGYTTPRFGQAFSATVNFFSGEAPDPGNDGVADGFSASINYAMGDIKAAVAHDRDIEGENIETTRVVAGYTIGSAQVMAMYQRTDVGVLAEDGFGASIAWKFGKNTAKFQYLTADIWHTDAQTDPLDNRYETLFSAGLDHALSGNTRLFAFYTTGDIGGTGESDRYAAIGIEHNF